MARIKKENIISENTIQRDPLISLLYEKLNDNNSGEHDVYFLDEENNPALVKDWISTGSSMLDLAISNRPHGGLPVGKLVEFNGLESTGKSLICAHIVKHTQEKGGIPIYIDTENSAAPEFWASLGVNLKNLMIVRCTTVELIFETMEKVIGILRKENKNKILTIIVDSVAAASTKAEMEKDYNKDGYATDKSILISKAMRKITNMIGKEKVLVVFTNQLRQNLKAVTFGDQYTVSGGKALQYHCSVRVRLNNVGNLTNKSKMVIGNKCKAKVIKNRMGPPKKEAQFDIYYDSGIADYASWVSVLKDYGITKQAGPYYKYIRNNGQEWQFQSKDFISTIENDDELKEEIYIKICDCLIMKYKDPNSKIVEDVDVVEDEDDVDMDSSIKKETNTEE